MSNDSPTLVDRSEIEALERRTERERRARLSAEKLLEEKSLELYQANQDLKLSETELQKQVELIGRERDRVVTMSEIDFLTQLPNRNALLQRLNDELLEQAQSKPGVRKEVWLAVILIKRFKRINSRLGQIGGDIALQSVGYKLNQSLVSYKGYAARYSGTEFAVVFIGDLEKFEELLLNITESLDQPLAISGKKITLETSIAAAGSQTAGTSVDQLRTAVDSALSKVRRNETQRVLIYDKNLHEEFEQRKTLEHEVRMSIQLNEFVSWFQPIIYADNTPSICLEALARWPKHGGIVTPNEFIPAASDLGLWEDLDHQLFMSACQQAKSLIAKNLVHDLSINVSPSQFLIPGFVETLRDQLNKVGFPHGRLILEITENALIVEPKEIANQIHALHALGIKVAVDDFGTGYSNLRNLIDLPIDTVKIDRSLIKELGHDNRATMLVSTLVQWARAINVSVVAEGVENETQALLLRALGCDKLQGFHYGRAMPAALLADRIPLLLNK
jgi:diguanylate cyclase (GGDEF)-like protein